ncbi:uncharacterized protein LOC127555343 [Antechinus flavipes]|uniref:uncharacterized protein LOC127555343 n=1 Tax=Antechinus flavipes TaxID=38775 RepID=UPI0022368AC0|nr:uncharacterized protein LOC127555343 [Antechinus flavipes]
MRRPEAPQSPVPPPFSPALPPPLLTSSASATLKTRVRFTHPRDFLARTLRMGFPYQHHHLPPHRHARAGWGLGNKKSLGFPLPPHLPADPPREPLGCPRKKPTTHGLGICSVHVHNLHSTFISIPELRWVGVCVCWRGCLYYCSSPTDAERIQGPAKSGRGQPPFLHLSHLSSIGSLVPQAGRTGTTRRRMDLVHRCAGAGFPPSHLFPFSPAGGPRVQNEGLKASNAAANLATPGCPEGEPQKSNKSTSDLIGPGD